MNRRPVSLLFLFVLMTSVSLADEATLSQGEASIPSEFSEAIVSALDSSSLSVSLEGSPVAHFWLRQEIPLAETPSSELGVTFGQIASGTLLGGLELLTEWKDYKQNSIPAGTYTLRYGLMPADGNHMGVAPYRDFLMLLPPDADSDPDATLDLAELLVGSSQASGVTHPAVLALFPIWDEVSEPTLVKNEMDQWTLAVKLNDQVLGLVVQGHGEVH